MKLKTLAEPEICSRCGAEWPPPGPRFCGGCGHRLYDIEDDPGDGSRPTPDAASLSATARRRVTAQVVGAAIAVALVALVLNGVFGGRAEVVDVVSADALVPPAEGFDDPVDPDLDPEACAEQGCFVDCAPPPTLAHPVLWCRDHGGSAAPPIVAGSRVVLVEPGGLLGVERVTGEQRWRVPIGDTGASVPTVTDPQGLHGQLVLVADGSTHRLLALSLVDGSVVWRGPEGSDGRATALGSQVLVVGSEGMLWSLDGRTGEPTWSTQTSAPAWRAPLVTGGGMVVTLSPDGLETWNVDTGEGVWRRTLGVTSFSEEELDLDDEFPVLGPVVVDDRVVVATIGGTVVAAHERTGVNLWDRPFGRTINSHPVASDTTVYALTSDDVLHAIDLETGARLGDLRVTDVIGRNRAMAVGRANVFVTTGNEVRAIGTDDLQLNAVYDLGRQIVGSPIVSGQTLYVTTRQALYVFDTGSVEAS